MPRAPSPHTAHALQGTILAKAVKYITIPKTREGDGLHALVVALVGVCEDGGLETHAWPYAVDVAARVGHARRVRMRIAWMAVRSRALCPLRGTHLAVA